SGDDGTQLALILLGAAGSISVTANVAPKLMHDMIAAALARDIDNALIINNKLLPLHQKLFVEANPIPVKWALKQMGLIESGIRLPLVELGTAYHATVREAMRHAGIA
ncbi:MAG: dihydrodipicolinate synthase family protein, partial [Burkholderiales bacterium]